MLTNLIASVVITLTTNVVERFPQHQVADPTTLQESINLVYKCHYENDADPHKKWIRTTIKRVTTVTFDMAGKPYSASREEVVSDSEVEYSLERKENWIKAP